VEATKQTVKSQQFNYFRKGNLKMQIIQLDFYDRLSPELASEVKEKTGTVKKLARRMAMDAWVIGKELTEIKRSLGNLFDEWLDREFSWSGSTANNFMRVYTAFSENELKNLDFAVTALYSLASPNCPDGARKEAIEIAQSGKKVTAELGKLIRERNEIAYRPKVGDRVRSTLGNNSGVVVHLYESYATVNWGKAESIDDFIYLLPVFKPGDRVRWADNIGTFLKEIGESGQIEFDQIPQGYDSKIQTIHLQLLCYNNSTCVQALGSVSPTLDCLPEKLNSGDFVNGTNTVEISSNSDTQEQKLLKTSNRNTGKTGNELGLISLPPHLPVPPSPCKENDSEPTTNEIVSPTLSTQSIQSSPNTGPLRTSQDSSVVPSDQEVPSARLQTNPISTGSLINSPTTKLKPLRLTVQSLDQSLREADCFLLASPGALSSDSSRSPGQSKHEAQLKKLGLISSGEVVSPRILEGLFGLPVDWTNPSEYRAATELSAIAEKHWEIPLIQELQCLLSSESSISIRCDKKPVNLAIAILQNSLELVQKVLTIIEE
jgi:hypothetical protein